MGEFYQKLVGRGVGGADGAVSAMTADNKQLREDLCNWELPDLPIGKQTLFEKDCSNLPHQIHFVSKTCLVFWQYRAQVLGIISQKEKNRRIADGYGVM